MLDVQSVADEDDSENPAELTQISLSWLGSLFSNKGTVYSIETGQIRSTHNAQPAIQIKEEETEARVGAGWPPGASGPGSSEGPVAHACAPSDQPTEKLDVEVNFTGHALDKRRTSPTRRPWPRRKALEDPQIDVVTLPSRPQAPRGVTEPPQHQPSQQTASGGRGHIPRDADVRAPPPPTFKRQRLVDAPLDISGIAGCAGYAHVPNAPDIQSSTCQPAQDVGLHAQDVQAPDDQQPDAHHQQEQADQPYISGVSSSLEQVAEAAAPSPSVPSPSAPAASPSSQQQQQQPDGSPPTDAHPDDPDTQSGPGAGSPAHIFNSWQADLSVSAIVYAALQSAHTHIRIKPSGINPVVHYDPDALVYGLEVAIMHFLSTMRRKEQKAGHAASVELIKHMTNKARLLLDSLKDFIVEWDGTGCWEVPGCPGDWLPGALTLQSLVEECIILNPDAALTCPPPQCVHSFLSILLACKLHLP